MTQVIWEYGSDFHYISDFVGSPSIPWIESCIFTLSGRTALLALLRHLEGIGKLDLQTSTIWLPAYTCNQLPESLESLHYLVKYWDGNPLEGWKWPLSQMNSGDVWILHNYFGLDVPGRHLISNLRERGIMIVEDHSHDPLGKLACESEADYAFASLRKSLPLPDGGAVWSPQGCSLPDAAPPAPTPTLRIAAMLGKAAYLKGGYFQKEQYREWFAAAEDELAGSPALGQSEFSWDRLSRFDTAAWQAARERNLTWLWENFPRSPHYAILGTPQRMGTLGLVLLCRSNEVRNLLRLRLTELQVYTAVLWPLPEGVSNSIFPQATKFQEQMLFVHADGRYKDQDLIHLCSRFKQAESTL